MDQNLPEIQSRLQDYYHQTFPKLNDAQIVGVTPLTEGWESIIYAFKVVTGPQLADQSQNLILRIYPGTDAHLKSQREFEGMQMLHQLGYPVPKVYHLERENSPFGQPFLLMEKIEGELLWPVLEQSPPERMVDLLSQFCTLFVQLHQLDWQSFRPKAEQADLTAPYIFVDRYLAWLGNAAATFPDLNAFQPVLNWLEARKQTVPCSRPAPVHWDFHPANVILRPDGTMCVIDWTQIQVSDHRFDLAWTLLLAGTYIGDEIRNLILSEYQRLSGADTQQLAFFDVANAIKRLGSVMISLTAGADQMGMRPEAIENMRRDFPALQRVYDLMVDRTGIRISEVEALFFG